MFVEILMVVILCVKMQLISVVIVLVTIYIGSIRALNEAQLKSTGKLARKSCQPKAKATDEDIDNMHKGQWSDDPTLQHYAYCIMGMFKLVDKQGKFDEQSALKQLDQLPKPRQEPAVTTLENCKGTDVGATKHESAYNFLKCTYFDNPENYFAP